MQSKNVSMVDLRTKIVQCLNNYSFEGFICFVGVVIYTLNPQTVFSAVLLAVIQSDIDVIF